MRLASVAVNVNAKRNSFHAKRNVSSATDARPGAVSGRCTAINVRSRPAPSSAAASLSSRGTSRMKRVISQITKGKANDASASTSAAHVSRRPSTRITR